MCEIREHNYVSDRNFYFGRYGLLENHDLRTATKDVPDITEISMFRSSERHRISH
jgi:hypothetical protein